MKKQEELRRELAAMDRRSYPAYKSLKGQYDFGDYVLSIDHVQGDPFAAPSHLSATVPMARAGFPREFWQEKHTRIALEDCLLRRFAAEIARLSFRAKGSGKSGLIGSSRPGQEILRRSALSITEKAVTVRFEVGFPANGRTINAGELEKVLFTLLPPVMHKTLYAKSWDKQELRRVFALAEDQEYIRRELPKRGLVAFVAEGSILPRVSGVSSKPMADAIPLTIPEKLRVELTLPHHGRLAGMGIPRGVTLIIGGGYHGKSTLLQALEQGVYNHIAGDGREFVITEETALKLRAEDGRSVQNLDLSLFIHNLPNGKATASFSTADASGSTSQAAAVMEGIEMGSRTFLIDEDTSATNFLVRDEFMQKIVHGDKEPITPFCARVRDLYEKAGISTILVAGSSGAFFYMADTVIQMDAYRPDEVKAVVDRYLPDYPLPEFPVEDFFLPEKKRVFWGISGKQCKNQDNRYGNRGNQHGNGGNPYGGRGGRGENRGRQEREERIKTKVMSTDGFSINHEMVDLRYVEQLVDSEQTATLAAMMKYVRRNVQHGVSVEWLAGQLDAMLQNKGLEAFMEGYAYCGLAEVRPQEIFAMLNRVRS